MTLPVTPPEEPDFMETYEQLVDRQMEDEAREAEDEGTSSWLAAWLA